MPQRKVPLITGEYYHIYNRGFRKRKIFLSSANYGRAYQTLQYYQLSEPPFKFSHFQLRSLKRQQEILVQLDHTSIEVIAFCFMPNHFHILIKQLENNGINHYISKFSLSYAKYFNTLHEKSGPVFEGRFKAVLVNTNEQLLHLSRYIHLNPYTASIAKTINELKYYPYSSLKEYLHSYRFILSQPQSILDQFESPEDYLKFVTNHADYQKDLHQIKNLTLD